MSLKGILFFCQNYHSRGYLQSRIADIGFITPATALFLSNTEPDFTQFYTKLGTLGATNVVYLDRILH